MNKTTGASLHDGAKKRVKTAAKTAAVLTLESGKAQCYRGCDKEGFKNLSKINGLGQQKTGNV